MSEPKTNPVRAELEAMRMKADLQVTSHSYLRDYYLGWGQRLNLYTLLFSAALLLFTLTPSDFLQRTLDLPPDGYRWVMAAAAFLTFCLSLVDLAWNPTAKSKAHDQAVGHYLRMIYELRSLMIVGKGVDSEKVRWIQEEFLDASDLPRIPEGKALVFKQRHLVKLALAQLLEQNPHRPLWWLKLRLLWNPHLAEPLAPPAHKAAALPAKPPKK
ncbi:MAG TPA: hypothetical protein VK914_02775 [bacterium]|jgi:hypothetical protein|nr:hypothetical protein [bacterium]